MNNCCVLYLVYELASYVFFGIETRSHVRVPLWNWVEFDWGVLLLFPYSQSSFVYDVCMTVSSAIWLTCSVLTPSDCYCAPYRRSVRNATRWLVQVRSGWWRQSSGTGPCGIPHASCAVSVRSFWWTSRTVFTMTSCTVRGIMPSSWSHAVLPAMRWVWTLQASATVKHFLLRDLMCVVVGIVSDRWFFYTCRAYQLWLFKAYRLLDAPAGLTLKNSAFCPHRIYVLCIYLVTYSNFMLYIT
jgi:hypothetical protein